MNATDDKPLVVGRVRCLRRCEVCRRLAPCWRVQLGVGRLRVWLCVPDYASVVNAWWQDRPRPSLS